MSVATGHNDQGPGDSPPGQYGYKKREAMAQGVASPEEVADSSCRVFKKPKTGKYWNVSSTDGSWKAEASLSESPPRNTQQREYEDLKKPEIWNATPCTYKAQFDSDSKARNQATAEVADTGTQEPRPAEQISGHVLTAENVIVRHSSRDNRSPKQDSASTLQREPEPRLKSKSKMQSLKDKLRNPRAGHQVVNS